MLGKIIDNGASDMTLKSEEFTLFGQQNKNIAFGKIGVRSVYAQHDYLIVDFNPHNMPKDYEIGLINKKIKDFQQIDYISDSANVKIDFKNLPDISSDIKGKWVFVVKSFYQGYELLEEMMIEGEWEQPKVIKDLDTLDRQLICSGIYVDKQGSLIFCQLPSSRYKKTTRESIKKDFHIRHLSVLENRFTLEVENDIPDLGDGEVEIILTSRKTKERFPLAANKQHHVISGEIAGDFLDNLPNSRWDIIVEFLTNDLFVYGKFGIDEMDTETKGIAFKELTMQDAVLLYRTDNGNLALVKGKGYNVFREKNQITATLTKLKKTGGNKFYFNVKVTSAYPVKITQAALRLRSDENDRNIYVDDITVKMKDNHYHVSGYLTMVWDKFSPLYWDFLLLVSDHTAREGCIRVNKSEKYLIEQIDKNYFKHAVHTKDKIMYPYVTLSNNIAFTMREKEAYETMKNGVKKTFAYGLYKMLKRVYFDKKDIWLGFEKFSKTAQDNGYAFFSYVDRHQLHDDFYYIIDKNSPDYEKIKNDSNNIIPFMSFKYMLLVFAAKLLVSSETKRHAYNIRIRSDRIARALYRKRSVFLQHGVTGLKRSDVFKKAKGRGNFDLVVATSEMEKEIIKNHWKYDEDEIIVTGFSRWDLLYDKSNQLKKKKIFVMPTWRTWIEGLSKEDFHQTPYYQNYVSFLKNIELHSLLSENNIEPELFILLTETHKCK